MVYHIQDIMRDVRVAIDHNATNNQLLFDKDTDTLTVDEIIRSKIMDAARIVEMSAPTRLLESSYNLEDSVFWEGQGRGYVVLPDDFMRLVAFRMSDWERTVFTTIEADSVEYAKQSSRYKGIRGNPQKPICAVINRPIGKVLEFYACKDEDAEVTQASYRPYPQIDPNDGIDISEQCYSATIYLTASLVLHTFGEKDLAITLSELAKSFYQI